MRLFTSLDLRALSAAAPLIVVASLFAGPLNPPVGPVVPTMKTLQQVEPRTPVQSLSGNAQATYVIDQPGSYYLTENIVGFSQAAGGILITSDNVTIDLRGFTIQGFGSQGPGFSAISSFSGVKGVSVFNGIVEGWTTGVVLGEGARIDGLIVRNCVATGILAENLASVSNCTVQNCSSGIEVGNNGRVQDCSAADCSALGIRLGNGSSAVNCTANSCETGISWNLNCTITGCSARDCGTGIGGVSGGIVQNCTATSCAFGLFANADTLFTDCNASSNLGNGIQSNARSTIRNCIANDNTSGSGILVLDRCTLDSNQIEGNLFGITSFGGENLVIRNRAVGNGAGNFNLNPADYVAPVLAASDLSTNTNPNANFGF